MSGKVWLVVVGGALLVAGSGCVSCGYQSCKPSLESGPTCDVPLCNRQHVYAVLLNGLTPGLPCGLDGLREKLAGHGFTKVYCGQLCHVPWLRQEMTRVHADDPAARFVVVGYDYGCAWAARMAADAAGHQIPVDGVVLLNPQGKLDITGCPARTVLVNCGADAATHADAVSVAGANHFTLPTQQQTVETVCGLLTESAGRVELPPVVELPTEVPEGFPQPRTFDFPGTGVADEWLFLHDRAGPHAVPLPPVPVECQRPAVPLPPLPGPNLPAYPLPMPRPAPPIR